MKQKSLKLNMLFNTINTVVGLIFPVITFPYSSRVLGPENIGKVNFSHSIVSYFVLLAGAGIGTYGIREIAKRRDDKVELSTTFLEILLFNLLTTLIAYIIFFVVLFAAQKLVAYRQLLYILSTLIVFGTISINWLYTGMEDYGYMTARNLLFQIISFVLLFCIVKNRHDYVGYASLLVISSGGSSIFNLIHARKYVNRVKLSELHIFRHAKPLIVFFVTAISATLHTLIDQTMIGILVDDRNVGLYVASTKIVNILTSLVVSVSGVLLPRLSYLAEKDKEALHALLDKMINILLILSVPFVMGLFIESGNIILLICGQEYAEAFPILRIFSLLLIVIVFTNLIGNQLFISIGKEKWLLISTSIGLVFNVILNAVLIPHFQAMGAAVATVVSESIVLLIQLIMFVKETNYKLPILSIIVIIINSLAMTVLLFFVRNLFENVLLSFGSSVIAGIAMYFALLLLERNTYLYEILGSVKRVLHRKNNSAEVGNGE